MTNVQLIKRHEEGAKNWRFSLTTHEERLKKEFEKLEVDKLRLYFFEFQIQEAKKEGKTQFDRDKYKVKRQKNE